MQELADKLTPNQYPLTGKPLSGVTVWQCDTDINILCLCTPVCHSRAAGSPGLMTGCETEPVAEVKVKESPATILMLSSNSDWENNSPPSPEGVMLLCQSPAGLSAVWLSWLVSLSHCHTRTGYCNIGLMMWLWGGPTCDWPVAPCHCTPPSVHSQETLCWLSSLQSYQNFLFAILVLIITRLSGGCENSTNTWRRLGQCRSH